MKKQVINYSLPAFFSDFNQDTSSENFSRGKLKVFYKGETDDHRYFSDEFSDELVKSLPYTPIVSYYDEEKEDFVGHATQQQILGIVDPCKAPTFEEHDGCNWCVCDVVLYTERPDKVGDIAKKIVGHKQSLELDPSSVKYTINYDEKKHFKNIEFTAGRFVGVSVLGNDQKPAFTGSEFFAYNEEFEKKMQILREYCESKDDQILQGGEPMNFQEFMKLSWGDISCKVAEKISLEYENDAFTYIVDMYENCAIVRFHYYIEGTQKLMRVNYSCGDTGEIVLGDVKEVYIKYVDVEEKQEIDIEEVGFETSEAAEISAYEVEEKDADEVDADEGAGLGIDEKVEDEADAECKDDEKAKCEDNNNEEETSIEEVDENKDEEKVDYVEVDKDDESEVVEEPEDVKEPAYAEYVEITPENKNENEKVSVDHNEEIFDKQVSSSTSFTESERAEFEALKHEKKISLIDSYKDFLTNEQYDHFCKEAATFEIKDLELELLKAYKAREVETIKPMRAFAFAPNNNANKENTLDSFVRKNLR